MGHAAYGCAVVAAGLLVYTYIGYPMLVAVVGYLRGRGSRQGPELPPVSMIIAAYNEQACIGARMADALRTDYPADRFEVIVASDGSDDRTVEIARAVADPRVRVLDLPRRGKIFALNDAVRVARGEILVFSDANVSVESAAVRALVRNFADPAVGGVVGNTGYRLEGRGDSSGRGESLYWRYEAWLKELESRTGSIVSAHGGLYAIRRGLYDPPQDGAVTDDFAISTSVIAAGFRLVFEKDARAWEAPAPTAEREFRRRVRLMTRGLRSVALRRELLNPLRYGFYSLALFSHKVLRRLAVIPLAVLLVSSLALSGESSVFAAAAAAQLGFYGAAMAGLAFRRATVGRLKVLYVPFYYCMANVAATVAWIRFLTGHRVAAWQPQRHQGA